LENGIWHNKKNHALMQKHCFA